MSNRQQIAIIGAGPAGAACAIQLKREGFSLLLFEKNRAGGTLRMAGSIENMPFIPAGTPGETLCDIMESNLKHFNVNTVKCEVIQIEKTDSAFILRGAGNEQYQAEIVVIACGLAHSEIKLPDWLTAFMHRDAEIPDADGDVLVIGGGDVALDRAISWKERNQMRCVTVLNRSENWKALPALLERAAAKGIVLHKGSSDDLVPLEYGFGLKGESACFRHLIVHIGRKERLPHIIEDSKKITPHVATDYGETQIGGLFLAGDARRVTIRHASIAASDGMLTALEIASRIK